MMEAGELNYRTTDLARAASAHPNTVRLYEQWGFLAPAPRAANGYRRWTRDHLDQMIFARRALHGAWPGRRIRESALDLVRLAATGDLRTALVRAETHANLVREERARAEEAAAFLERWAAERSGDGTGNDAGTDSAGDTGRHSLSAVPLSAREAAEAVGATCGQIRNWERNRLISPRRDPQTGRRSYGPAEIGRLRVLRTLLLAGYSMTAILRMTTELDRGRTVDLRDVLDTPRDGDEVLTAFDRWLTALSEQEERAAGLITLLLDRIGRQRG